MSFEVTFILTNLAVLPAWAMLLLAPRWKWTDRIVHGGIYPLGFGLLYLVFLGSAIFFDQSSPEAGMTSITGVMALFDHPVGVLTGWTHFLIFDLFVGSWISRTSIQEQISRWVVTPVLILTFMFGPIGLLVFTAYRMATGGTQSDRDS